MLSVVEAESRRDLLLIDIRPLPERRSELGFIPGTLSVPLDTHVEGQLARIGAFSARNPRQGLVLCCTSGRRSAAAWEALAKVSPTPLYHLKGGQLAWAEAGLPLCVPGDPPGEAPADELAFRRHLIACFIAENAEVALDHEDADSNPYTMLQRCFTEEGVPWDQPSVGGLYRVLDRAAAATRHAGGDLAHIAANLGAMYALLDALARRSL